MPHEIIMPALGMAQDSGVIVQWLKSPGDAVAEGEALFEVETDKATMEVEAQAAGWLADVRARAGQEVPVGEVIAVIADAPEAVGEAPATEMPAPSGNDDAPAQPGAAAAKDLPERQEVIMPALGMAQDTGLIVAWSKAPGDAVSEDDTLLEVETDKSTMEVPAGAAGYVAALLAEAGQEVPVGEVIAVISAEKPANPTQTRAAAKPAPAPAPTEASAKAAAAPAQMPAAPPEPARKPAALTRAAPTCETGRIFASPRARRLAAEAGLDLSRLVAVGCLQPYHAADIETLRSLPAETPVAVEPRSARQITARAAPAPGRELLDWLKREEGRDLAAAALWLRFAAAALRRTRQGDGDLVIELAPSAPGRCAFATPTAPGSPPSPKRSRTRPT
jgi:pyruvate/2-oxoglutarate dehydrogenase complex dihydrolipoamide acyltransferase (E2) component